LYTIGYRSLGEARIEEVGGYDLDLERADNNNTGWGGVMGDSPPIFAARSGGRQARHERQLILPHQLV
jgi:hypothetical protein